MLSRRHLKRCPHRHQKRRHWRCQCPIWFDARINGSRVHKSTHLTDWDEAQALACRWIESPGDVEAQPIPPTATPTDKSISIEVAWQRFAEQARARKLSPVTIYKYDLLGRQMQEFGVRHKLHLLREFDLDRLEAFRAEWPDAALAGSKKLERLKAFFSVALAREWIDKNPAVHLKPPKVRPRPTLPFTAEEMRRILDAISAYPDKSGKTGRSNAVRLRAFVLLLRYTGMRIGDATSLTTDRISRNKVFLYTQKTGQPVYCVIPDFVADAIEDAPRLSEKHFFWTGQSTLHTAIGSWQRTLRSLFKLAGISKGFAHRFRDTFAVELLLVGVPTEEVATLLGHSNITITQRHYSPWVHSRQQQLEANLKRAWERDPIALVQNATASKTSARHALPN